MPSRIAPFVFVLVVWAIPAARANIGPPAYGGQIVGEPTGLRDIHISRETLTIDLRPLAESQPVRVEAVYRLDNRGEERKLDLLFIGGTPATAFDIRLDDHPVPSAPAPEAKLPAEWQPPATTPGLEGHDLDYLKYGRQTPTPQAFTATIPSGAHTLSVHYDAEAAHYHVDGPTITWQFAYVLAPARAWGGFGGLDVEVRLPHGWRAAYTPDLLRNGDVLRRNFDVVPADALALTVRAPAGPSYLPLVYGGQIVFGLAAFVGAVACAQSGWWCGRRRQRAWVRVGVLSVLWGVALVAAGAFAFAFGPDLAIPATQQNHYGYGQWYALLGAVFLGALAVPVGFALGLAFAAMARRRTELYTD